MDHEWGGNLCWEEVMAEQAIASLRVPTASQIMFLPSQEQNRFLFPQQRLGWSKKRHCICVYVSVCIGGLDEDDAYVRKLSMCILYILFAYPHEQNGYCIHERVSCQLKHFQLPKCCLIHFFSILSLSEEKGRFD